MINGKNVRLRAAERSDLPRFVRWINDPEVTAGLTMFAPLSTADEEAWFEGMIHSPLISHTLVIEARQGEEWVPIGNCGFHEIDTRIRMGEVGIFIGEKTFWNKGLGTEVMGLLVRYGFETLNLNRIFLQVYANNPRAIRCYQKVGFIEEGRMRQAMYKNGQYIDVVFMSILRSEWDPTRTAAAEE